jgi:predicted ArsR family transcriptional regulator
MGKEIGETTRDAAGDHDPRDTAMRVLEAYGFEPRIEGDNVAFVNCPFHTLAQEHAELVCGMNLSLLDGILDGLASTGLTAHLHPTPLRCCVRLSPGSSRVDR